jgi:hypothetical protein
MMVTAPTPFNTIFWQWANQTYNAVLNYGNRNASSNYTKTDIAKGYFAATSSSILICLGIRRALEPMTKGMKGSKLIVANSVSTFFACTSAGAINALLMR